MFMRWHCPTTRAPRKKKGNAPSSPWFFAGPAAKPHHHLQETEGYIHLYYKSRMVEPLHAQVTVNSTAPMISLIHQVARDLYQTEDDETRAAVKAYIDTKAAAALESTDLDAVEPTPELYQE